MSDIEHVGTTVFVNMSLKGSDYQLSSQHSDSRNSEWLGYIKKLYDSIAESEETDLNGTAVGLNDSQVVKAVSRHLCSQFGLLNWRHPVTCVVSTLNDNYRFSQADP
jgi:hypothetical protein